MSREDGSGSDGAGSDGAGADVDVDVDVDTDPDTGKEPGTGGGDLPAWFGKPCSFCNGAHSPFVHTVTDAVPDSGGGNVAPPARSPAPAEGSTDMQVVVNVDDLHVAGQHLFDEGMALVDLLAPDLLVVASLENPNPAGNDDVGMMFRRGYDMVVDGATEVNVSAEIAETLRVLGYGYAGMGVIAQKAAKSYADTDDLNASRTHKYIGIWGAE